MKKLMGAAIVSLEVIRTSVVAFAGTDDLAARVEKSGLIGRWATDCSPEATRGLVTYDIEPDGRVIIDNGQGQSLIEMQFAEINADGDLILHTLPASGGETRILRLHRSGDALRPVINGNDKNDVAVRDGKFVASVREAAPLRRCGS